MNQPNYTLNNEINLVCGLDQNYAPHLATMLRSLFDNNRSCVFVAHVLHDCIPSNIRKQVEETVKEIKFVWIEVSNHPVLDFEPTLHISRATFLRLLIPDMIDKAIEKVIYLDVDMIIVGSIEELYNTDLQGKVCAAVVDPGVDALSFSKKWGLNDSLMYFNAGVLVFDMKKLRDSKCMEKAIHILKESNQECEYGDQDALNIALWNDWLPVDPKWNFQRKFLYNNYGLWNKYTSYNRRPAIIHYTEEHKPWRSTEWHPCRWLYLKYLLKTSFSKSVRYNGGIKWHTIVKSYMKWFLKRPPMFKSGL